MTHRLFAATLALALSACHASGARPMASAPLPADPHAAEQPASAPPLAGRLDSAAAGREGIVSAADPRAAAAGAEILRRGGSAADAAIATMLALTVVEPQSSGIGGGGFLLHADARGRVEALDGRETAPAAATGDLFLRDGQPLRFGEAQPGGRSVGVPGNLRLAGEAHARHGRLPWAALFAPAIRLARDGFVLSPRLHAALDRSRRTGALDPQARALFYDAAGEPRPVGTLVRNPALARTLADLARLGADSFYVGPNARAIVAAARGAPVNPAAMSPGDLATYQARWRDPVCGTYRRHRVCSMGPPSSGATTLLAMLGQLERFDLAALGPDSPLAWHLFAESQRLAFADRDRFLADPDFVAVPVAGLIAPPYLARRSALIAPEAAMIDVVPGEPAGAAGTPAASGTVPHEGGTSHFVAVDRAGNAASYTSTVESAFGSGLMVGGYYLNNELTDFSFVPAVDGRPVANRVEGGKRPRSSMTPTLVFGPDGRLRLALGAAGGATIIAQVAKTIVGVIDWRLPAQQAIALPVLFAPGDTLVVERGTAHEAMVPALRALGHSVQVRAGPFKANAVERAGDRWVGAADPRSEGAAIAR